jgi:uncharacterized protein YbjT (DUF2867 family)
MTAIAVVGATGPSGRLVVAEALRRGHSVVAYVRRPDALAQAHGLTIVGGELDDTASFAAAIAGCDVVISTLGTRSMRDTHFMTRTLPYVVNAMRSAGLNRLVLMSALGGGEAPAHSRGLNRLIYRILSRTLFADRTRSELALQGTGITWCAVYPAFLMDGPAVPLLTGDLATITRVSQERVPRVNVATVLVDLAEDATCSGRRIVLAKRLKDVTAR